MWPNSFSTHENYLISHFSQEKSVVPIDLMCHSDVLIDHRIWSTLVQTIACYQMEPSHYLSQWWVIITEVSWHSPKENFRGNDCQIYSWYELKFTHFRLKRHLPGFYVLKYTFNGLTNHGWHCFEVSFKALKEIKAFAGHTCIYRKINFLII